MRICDWSSDVFSSDLTGERETDHQESQRAKNDGGKHQGRVLRWRRHVVHLNPASSRGVLIAGFDNSENCKIPVRARREYRRAACGLGPPQGDRKSVGQGKGWDVRVGIGGGGII